MGRGEWAQASTLVWVGCTDGHALWWIYSPYPILAFLAGVHLMIVMGHYLLIGGIATMMDAVALCAFYSSLWHKPLLTQRFWIGFVVLYVTKVALVMALLASLALEIGWDGSLTGRIVFMDCVGIVLGAPLLFAMVAFAFDAKRIWAGRHQEPAVSSG